MSNTADQIQAERLKKQSLALRNIGMMALRLSARLNKPDLTTRESAVQDGIKHILRFVDESGDEQKHSFLRADAQAAPAGEE